MNVRPITNSLVFRMLALVLFSLVIGGAVSYFQMTRFLQRDLTDVALARQAALADYVAGDVGRDVDARLGSLERLAVAVPPDLLAAPDRLCAWLRERHDLQPDFPLGFTSFDATGQPNARCTTSAAAVYGPISATLDIHPALAGTRVIGRPFRDIASGRPALAFAVPIRGPDRRVIGVLSGISGVADHGFLDLHRQGRIGQSGGLLLVSPPDRLFLGATEADMFFKPTPPEGVNPLHDRAMTGFRGSGVTVNARGVAEISAISAVPGTDWFVVARSPTDEALATVARAQSLILRQRIPAALCILLISMALMTWWLRPLFRAARQAERMARGDAPLSPLPVIRDDEIGHMTGAFNRLLAKLEQHQDELSRLAHHDGLTGLPNRRLFADRVDQASARARRHKSTLAVLFLDLDGFKQINDTLGHEAGDDALTQAANRLVGAVRASDTVARLGGDEFVILIADIVAGDDKSVATIVAKCVAAIEQPMHMEGHDPQILGVSVGIARSDGTRDAAELLAVADRAMYGNKAHKRADAPAGGDRFSAAAGSPPRVSA